MDSPSALAAVGALRPEERTLVLVTGHARVGLREQDGPAPGVVRRRPVVSGLADGADSPA